MSKPPSHSRHAFEVTNPLDGRSRGRWVPDGAVVSTGMGDLEDTARRVIDRNRYLTLATADRGGTPWISPLWFAHVGHTDLIWVSKLHREHTRNITERPEVSFVIYDSSEAPGDVEAVYGTGRAAPTDGDAHLAAYSERARSQGLPEWPRERVSGDSPFRLFHVITDHLWILDDHDDRIPVHL